MNNILIIDDDAATVTPLLEALTAAARPDSRIHLLDNLEDGLQFVKNDPSQCSVIILDWYFRGTAIAHEWVGRFRFWSRGASIFAFTQNDDQALQSVATFARLNAPCHSKRDVKRLPAFARAIHASTQQPRIHHPYLPQFVSAGLRGLYEDSLPIHGLSDDPVLLTGKTGMGKTLAAEWLAWHRALRTGLTSFTEELVHVNCATISDDTAESALFGHVRGSFSGAVAAHTGWIRTANNKTLFLDEIGALSKALQEKLYLAIEQRTAYPYGSTQTYPVTCRILAATNEPERLTEAMYHRFTISIRVLEPTREDIEAILSELIREESARRQGLWIGFDPKAMAFLSTYTWPGGHRQMKNIMRKASTDTIRGETSAAWCQKFLEDYVADRTSETGPNTSQGAQRGVGFSRPDNLETRHTMCDNPGQLWVAEYASDEAFANTLKRLRPKGMTEKQKKLHRLCLARRLIDVQNIAALEVRLKVNSGTVNRKCRLFNLPHPSAIQTIESELTDAFDIDAVAER